MVFRSGVVPQVHQWGVNDFGKSLVHPVLKPTASTSRYQMRYDFKGLRIATRFGNTHMTHDSLLDAYIDSNTGALVLSLTHLVTFDRIPSVTKMRKGLHQYAIDPTNPKPDESGYEDEFKPCREGVFNLGFVTPDLIEIRPFQDHIFRLGSRGIILS